MKNKLLLTLVTITISACATTYQAPTTQNSGVTMNHHSSKAEIIAKAKRALLLDGFQIASSDDQAGYISTAIKNWKLTPDQADCGTTMGIDYLKDNRTKTEVAFNVIVDEQEIRIRSNIQGEYKPGAVDQNITLTCVSKGSIEKMLVQKILH